MLWNEKITTGEEPTKEEWIDSGITHQLVPEYVSEDGKLCLMLQFFFQIQSFCRELSVQ